MAKRPSISSSRINRFTVFEFNEDENRVEKASEKFLVKFGNPKKSQNSSVTKYTFLECFAQGTVISQQGNSNGSIDVDVGAAQGTQTPEQDNKGLVDVDAGDMDHQCLCSVVTPLGDAPVEEKISRSDIILISSSPNYKADAHACPTYIEPGSITPGANSFPKRALNFGEISASRKHLSSVLTQTLSDNQPVGLISDDDDDDRIETSSSISASSCTGTEAPLEERGLEYSSGGYEIDNVNMKVVVFPDFILYGDIYCTEAQLTFTCGYVKLEGSTVNATKGTLNFEWAINDIIYIKTEWCGRVETAIVNLCLKSKDSRGVGNAGGTPVIEELKFAVYDPYWSEGQEAIRSLDVRYKDRWNVILSTDVDGEEDSLSGHSCMFNTRHYFPQFDKPFEDVIYPKGDPDAVSISKRDVELLQPETFINDTIVDFYIKYLKNRIQPEEKHRFHFFNSFFFRKLADLDKDPSSAREGKAAFQRVRKWTRKVDLFGKDYIFIPVNYSLHWSLIIICHPGEVANFIDEDIEKCSKVPCILHLDSIRGSHRGLKNLIQSYLCEEWKERHSNTAEDISSKFLHLRFVALELPQQENSFDCGLFLLHYIELFLEEAPVNFSPFSIKQLSNFLNRNWFAPAEASIKRAHIQKLIYEILQEHSPKALSVECIDKYPSFQLPDSNEQQTGVEFIEELCNSSKTLCGTINNSNAERVIEISVSAVSPPRGGQCMGESISIFRDPLESGISVGSLHAKNYQQIAVLNRRSIVSPIEEVEETAELIADSLSDTECYQATEFPTTSNEDFRVWEASCAQEFSAHLEEHHGDDLYSKKIFNGSQNTFEGFNHFTRTGKAESASTSSEGLAACVVEDSQEASSMHDGDVSKDSQKADSTEDTDHKANYMLISGEDQVSEADEEQGAKRPRLMPSQGKKKLTRSLSNELHS